MTSIRTLSYGWWRVRLRLSIRCRIDVPVAKVRTPRGAWVDAGLQALAAGGPEAVRIEPLAAALGVTKGGFYWHFADRGALLEEVLDTWERVSIDEAIERVEREGGDARARLRTLFALSSTGGELARMVLQTDLAVRDWARRDPAVAARLRRVDNRRMAYLRSLFAASAPRRTTSRPAAWWPCRCSSATTSSPPTTARAAARRSWSSRWPGCWPRRRRRGRRGRHGASVERMTIQRMDHVGIVVDDLAAATAFFVELGLELQGEASVEGGWVDRVVGLEGVRADIAMMETPDGHGRVELAKFLAPPGRGGDGHTPANAPGIRHLSFVVDDVDAVLARVRRHGAELVGEVERYEDRYRLCYVRGPEGVIVELAERIG